MRQFKFFSTERLVTPFNQIPVPSDLVSNGFAKMAFQLGFRSCELAENYDTANPYTNGNRINWCRGWKAAIKLQMRRQ